MVTHDQHVSLNSCLRIDNDSLASLCNLDSRLLDWTLITEQRGQTGLDESSGESEENEENDKDRECRWGRNDSRDGGDDQEEVCNHYKSQRCATQKFIERDLPPTPVPTQMVLNRPHLVSATIPPKMGIT